MCVVVEMYLLSLCFTACLIATAASVCETGKKKSYRDNLVWEIIKLCINTLHNSCEKEPHLNCFSAGLKYRCRRIQESRSKTALPLQ